MIDCVKIKHMKCRALRMSRLFGLVLRKNRGLHVVSDQNLFSFFGQWMHERENAQTGG